MTTSSYAQTDTLVEEDTPRLFPSFSGASLSGLVSSLGEAGRVAVIMAKDASDAFQAVADRSLEESSYNYERLVSLPKE